MKNILSYLYERRPRFIFSKFHIGGRGWHAGYERNGNCWNWRPGIRRFATCTFYRFGRFFFAKDRARISALATIALSCLLLPACALTPSVLPMSSAATSKVSIALDTIASAIRHAENAAMTPAQFGAFLDNYVALIPPAGPYIPDAKLAYSVLYAGGNIGAGALENLAARYDTR